MSEILQSLHRPDPEPANDVLVQDRVHEGPQVLRTVDAQDPWLGHAAVLSVPVQQRPPLTLGQFSALKSHELSIRERKHEYGLVASRQVGNELGTQQIGVASRNDKPSALSLKTVYEKLPPGIRGVSCVAAAGVSLSTKRSPSIRSNSRFCSIIMSRSMVLYLGHIFTYNAQ